MIDYETYKKVQEQLKLGVKLRNICKNLNISFMQLYRYGMLPEDLYLKTRESKIEETLINSHILIIMQFR